MTDANKPGHVFMLFEHPRGWLNSLTTDYVDPTTPSPITKEPKPVFARSARCQASKKP